MLVVGSRVLDIGGIDVGSVTEVARALATDQALHLLNGWLLLVVVQTDADGEGEIGPVRERDEEVADLVGSRRVGARG